MNELRSDYNIYKASQDAAYIGGDYYNPVEEFFEIARPLESSKLMDLLEDQNLSLKENSLPSYIVASIFKELNALKNTGEYVFAAYDRGKYKIAAFIYNEERLMDFEAQAIGGNVKRVGYFAVKEKDANKGLSQDFEP